MTVFDLRSVAYGLIAFITGYLILGAFGNFAAQASGNSRAIAWAALQLGGTLVPIIAGYTSAYYAHSRRILHGSIGGSLGVVLFIGIAVAFFDTHLAWAALLVIPFVALASLGAIIGNHLASKRGP